MSEARSPDHEIAVVTGVVQEYLDGTREADAVRLESAFYSSCNLHSIDDDGKLEILARDRFIDFAAAGLLPEHTSEVLRVEVVHDMASAKVQFLFSGYRFVDFLTLARVQGRWKIVSKVWTKIVE